MDASRANLPPLALHVPEPQFRPGDEADFSAVEVPPAGAARRPDTAEPAASFHELAYTLVRVLDEQNQAVGPWNPRLDAEALRKMLRSMALTRAFDERMFRAQRQGKTSFYMKSTGEEAVSVGAAMAMASDDMCFPSYRQQGILITRGYPLVGMMNQIYSNSADPLQGRQLPIMYSSKDHASSPSPATSRRSIPRRWAGRWHRPRRATRASPRPGAARARPRRATSTRR
jgi:2-oxoisovalerate dehydrogenase E1 component alpha subunit